MKAKLITADGAYRFWHIDSNKRGGWPNVLRFSIMRPIKAVDMESGTPDDLAYHKIREYEWVGYDTGDGRTLIYKEIVA